MQLRRMLDRRKESARRFRSDDRLDARSPALQVRSRGLLISAVLLLSLLSGCSTFSRDGDSGLLDVTSMLSPGSIRGPLERKLFGEDNPLEMGRRFSDEERHEVQQCRLAFERGDYDRTIKLSKKAAKKFKESSLGEEAQFYLAESWFAQGKFGKAQDAYDQLFQDYPSTRYVEPATRRLFAIAREWLEISDPIAKNAIRQVSGMWTNSTRRHWIGQQALGLGGLAWAWLRQQELNAAPPKPQLEPLTFDLKPKVPVAQPQATAMISMFMQGGPSHIDLFDPKPELNKRHLQTFTGDIQYDNAGEASSKLFGCPWRFRKYGDCGMDLSELVPHLGTVAVGACASQGLLDRALGLMKWCCSP